MKPKKQVKKKAVRAKRRKYDSAWKEVIEKLFEQFLEFFLKKELREKLETSTNPMALVVKAQLKSLEVNKADDNTKLNVARELIRECYKQGYSKKAVHTLVKFIEWVIRLSKALEKRLKEEIKKIEEEFKMPYLASWERSAQKEGIKKGKIEGKKEGKKEGKIEGKKEEKLDTAKRMLMDDISIDMVIKYTGLTEKEVKALMN